jgi:hypothetical protein
MARVPTARTVKIGDALAHPGRRFAGASSEPLAIQNVIQPGPTLFRKLREKEWGTLDGEAFT